MKKNILKFIAFIGGCILIFLGLGSIFLWSKMTKENLGWSMAYITWGLLMIRYWMKK